MKILSRVMMSSVLFILSCVAEAMPVIKPLSAEYKALLINNHLWYPACPVNLSRLREVTVNYYDFQDHLHTDGKLIVLDVMALQTAAIFSELEKRHFPINKIKPTSAYHGDDESSMEDNNTSAFNCRPVTGNKNQFSLHAYGVAIDLNPLQNPYIGFKENASGEAFVLPKNATQYVNRIFQVPGSSESVVAIFANHGFREWGGHWHAPIDYQHFQVPRSTVEEWMSDA